MPRKKTLEEITSYVDTMGNGEYEVIPPYVNSKTKMEFFTRPVAITLGCVLILFIMVVVVLNVLENIVLK